MATASGLLFLLRARGGFRGPAQTTGAVTDPAKLRLNYSRNWRTFLGTAELPSALPKYRHPYSKSSPEHSTQLYEVFNIQRSDPLANGLPITSFSCQHSLEVSEIYIATGAGCYLLNLQDSGEWRFDKLPFVLPRRRGLPGVLVLCYGLAAKTEPFRCNISWKRRDDKSVKAPSPRGGPLHCGRSNPLCHNTSGPDTCHPTNIAAFRPRESSPCRFLIRRHNRFPLLRDGSFSRRSADVLKKVSLRRFAYAQSRLFRISH